MTGNAADSAEFTWNHKTLTAEKNHEKSKVGTAYDKSDHYHHNMDTH